MTATADVVTRDSPYKGLTPYTEEDAQYFFGREDETRMIAANLLASRLTLLYGASGVGKSSLLAAGVKRYLDELADESIRAGGSPDCITVAFPSDREEDDCARESWRDDPVDSIATAIEKAARTRVTGVEPPPRTRDLAKLIEDWTELLDADVLLILDQFEEYFLYHGEEDEEGSFATGLSKILKSPGLRANVLISIRDDAYALLDRFKGQIPFLYDNYLRVAHLSRESARNAITAPVEQYNKLVAGPWETIEVAPDLTESVLAQVQSGEVVLGQSGRGAVRGGENGAAGVETPFLQLVMERLWEKERDAGSRVLRLETLVELGGADRIVRTHLDAAMTELSDEEQEAAARVFGRLVTPSGTKITHLASDLAAMESLPPERVKPMLERLSEARILRPVAPPPPETESRYQIFHDVLAPAVLDWRARWVQARRHHDEQAKLQADLEHHEEERHRAEALAARQRATARKLRRLAAIAVVFAVGAIITAFVAVQKETEVRRANDKVAASRLERKVNNTLKSDPAAALPLAARLVQKQRDADGRATPEALGLLRQAVRAAALLAVLRPPSGADVGAGVFSGDGGSAVTIAGDRIDTWFADDGAPQHDVRAVTDGRLLNVASNSNGSRVVAGTDDGRTLLWTPPATDVETLGRGKGPVVQVAISADGDRALSVTASDRIVRVWTLGRPKPDEFELDAAPTLAQFDASGDRVLVGTRKGATVYDVATKRPTPLRWPAGARQPARAAAFSPDGGKVVVGGGARESDSMFAKPKSWLTSAKAYAGVWDSRTGRLLGSLSSSAAVTSVAWDHAGERVASGRADGVAKIWALPRRPGPGGVVQQTLRGHSDQVSSVSFSPNGLWVITGSRDGTARVWSARTGSAMETLLGHGDAVAIATFSAGSSRILTVSDDHTARLWRVPEKAAEVVKPKDDYYYLADISPDGEHVLGLSVNDRAKLVDVASRKVLRRFPDTRAWFAAFGADATTVLTADINHIATWDSETGEEVSRHELNVNRAPAAIRGGQWAAVDTPKGVRMWDTVTGALGQPLPGSKGYHDLTLSPDGRFVAGVRRHALIVWNVNAGSEEWRIDRVPSGTVAVSPDGRTVVVGATGAAIGTRATAVSATKVFTRGKREPRILSGHDAVTVIRFSNDGSRLLTAGEENTARVWDENWKAIPLRGHEGGVNDASFSPAGRLVVTAGEDGTGRVFDARTGEVFADVGQESGAVGVTAAFTDSGRGFGIGKGNAMAIYRCEACGGEDGLLERAGALKARALEP